MKNAVTEPLSVGGGGTAYYIINFDIGQKYWGLLSIYNDVLLHTAYAKSKGLIPIVDMQHCCSLFFKEGRDYKDNIWEYFFEQPGNVSLKDLTDTSTIITKDNKDLSQHRNFQNLYFEDISKYKSEFLKYYKTFDLIKFNQETQKYLDDIYAKTIGNETEVLGIILRGTDYTANRPAHHKIQPAADVVIKKAKELQQKFHYKKIWLATEDNDIYKLFKKEFGNTLIENFQYKYNSHKGIPIAEYPHKNRKEHYYNLSKEYLASIYILSKCKYLIGGFCGGTRGAFFLSKGFENQSYVYLWNIGTYGEGLKPTYKNNIEKIFSVTNEYFEDDKFKILKFFGLKLKFKAGKRKNCFKEYINI